MVLHVATGMVCQVPAIQEVNPMIEPDTRKHNLFVLTLTILCGVILRKWCMEYTKT